MKFKDIVRGIIIIMLCAGCQGKSAQSLPPLKIGYMICNSLQESKARFEPLTAYLSERLDRPCISLYINTADFEDIVKKKGVDFAHSNSILYIIFKKEYGATLIAGELRGRYGSMDAGTIIVRRQSKIKAMSDLRGKSMVFGPALAPMGYLSQYDLMLKSGIDPELDLSYYAIPWGAFKHEKVIYGVLYGAFDAGAAPRLDLDHMIEEGKIREDDFRILGENEPIAYCTMSVLSHVDTAIARKVKDIMLAITKDDTVLLDGEVVKILRRFWIDGFVEVKDSDYDPIRTMLKNCNMYPYEEY
ncbi:MAG: phosphate/phosphite/phosphonate ABC transporter substrate-binding protein [bacterium]